MFICCNLMRIKKSASTRWLLVASSLRLPNPKSNSVAGAHRDCEDEGYAQLDKHLPNQPEHCGPAGAARLHAHRPRGGQHSPGDLGTWPRDV